MEKKVKVLLSAYNGEQYIAAQLDSILAQTYQNIEIYVRDDGSKDNTLAVLEPYAQDGLIHLEEGENVGFIRSFFWLVEHCGKADYFAFSDQDDVWFEDKIEMALQKLETADNSKPILYFSNYDFYDGELNFVEHGMNTERKPSFRNCLVDCISLGFNSVFNSCARELMAAQIPQHSCGHDWWTYMVCQGLGKVIYDERPTVKYRRHESNVSAGGMDFVKFQIWRFKKFFVNDYFKNVREQLCEYEQLYHDKLSEQDQKILALFTKHTFAHGVKKVFYPHRFRQGMVDELMLRMIFLIGKL